MKRRLMLWRHSLRKDLPAFLVLCAGTTVGFLSTAWQTTAIEAATSNGVVVEQISEGSALANAGLQVGDILFSWQRLPNPPANPEGARGELGSVFDWLWLEQEQAPRGTVKLFGEREGTDKVFEVVLGLWNVRVRARMPPELLESYLRGKQLTETGIHEQGISFWGQAAEMARRREDERLECWLRLRMAEAWSKARAWEKADAAYRSALDAAREPEARVAIWDNIGKVYKQRSDFARAEASYRMSLRIRRTVWGEGMSFATSLHDLGIVALLQAELEQAWELFERALEIQQNLAPGGLGVARFLEFPYSVHLSQILKLPIKYIYIPFPRKPGQLAITIVAVLSEADQTVLVGVRFAS